MSNKSLISDIKAWAVSAGVAPRSFDCKFYDQCNGQNVMLDRGNTAVMSYLGREYGEPSVPAMPRLVIVGMDHGCHASLTFDERREQIEEYESDTAGNFNPHYAGVVRTAAAFLGRHGTHCADACRARCARSRGPVAVDVCVLDRLAQPNLVKCVSSTVPNATCKATRVMRTNCCNHLVAELGLLRPDIVVVHGIKEQCRVLKHMEIHGIEHFDLGERIGISKVLYNAPGLGCHFVFLWHPSRNMMDRIWALRAVPTITYLTELGIIPAAPPVARPGRGPVGPGG